MTNFQNMRNAMRRNHLTDQTALIDDMIAKSDLPAQTRKDITQSAVKLIEDIRSDSNPGLMEVFLAEYGLSTDEGVALMCLAEALLRVPDADTIDDLIEDKIAPSSWGEHLGQSSSSLVNASTWALMLTGKVLDERKSSGVAGVLHGAIKRLGEPVIRTAVKRAIKEIGNQFVLGETIQSAMDRAAGMEKKGFSYSYDMLGEAALTQTDADAFFKAYENSIQTLSKQALSDDIRQNPGISIKLSALHPRYEVSQKTRVMTELVDRTIALAVMAKNANMGLNIDAEEADRLDLSLDVIETVLSDPRLADWNGFGVVVQAYGKRAANVIDWLYALAQKLGRKIMVRLVKGAYWDTEIKRAQVTGMTDFPVFTSKSATDVSYICCAQQLLGMTDRIYPQFATHNAHSVAAILHLSDDKASFEFQRLHGMGEVMHRQVMKQHGTRCRIYAPVGAHRDLLAYLVRRLLENGANSSFVNQIVDETVPAADIATDPFDQVKVDLQRNADRIKLPRDLYAPERQNSRGWDLHDYDDLADVQGAIEPFKAVSWTANPLIAGNYKGDASKLIINPADPTDMVGKVTECDRQDVEVALSVAQSWTNCAEKDRAVILNKAADLYEENYAELFAVLIREAGKTPMDAIAELREAMDFLRYYATQIGFIDKREARGVIACISPWNFPLAIFTGQIAAALAAGNGVVAKPADPTPIIATLAVKLLHDAGVPNQCLQLLPGRGSVVGAVLVSDPRIDGVCFTGSTATAQTVNLAMADDVSPDAPLIAETGGLNAMIVDSTALPEQAVKDIVASSFQSAGQRCSALRLLYLQEDIAPEFMDMLFGAMDELVVGNPWDFATDVGPVINQSAAQGIQDHIAEAKTDGRLLKQIAAPVDGIFIGPAVIKVTGIADMQKEIFGPVLHVATFKSSQVDQIVTDINASGYGLTFGLHTRIDDRVEHLTRQLNVGNMYINRNQIGAVVGTQPFGGEGLSGTGPKAGGPHYLHRFTKQTMPTDTVDMAGPYLDFDIVQNALMALDAPNRMTLVTYDMPGPTGESNRLSLHPRGKVLCLGPRIEQAQNQAKIAQDCGCTTLIVCSGATGQNAISGQLNHAHLEQLTGFDVVAIWTDIDILRTVRQALAKRNGPIIPIATQDDMEHRCVLERHICIDTTASGGNASLLAMAD
ncbi:bifunctional proline dehydrogenase/L-glutamate gamma-semialdehyde dehydrogenase PutA [Parasulfitobacter algicola]|uniref:Bifunctional protein PutA n=1 Tax=Parasulfitobacter algicola TaxID=2614809 RepID=A0ABX2IVN1_9RHOB|nr:bifunctional proline dehydrogenase/L-glutamate gamma-semialdehyde dehydrogenase PutA [Sulfitobacter algicola]NSX54336.1 bifunctional proline dehydrogenase/L-glutamate gamma-semialdehyde dehydrogenase PutA [Sulfitobacter algicola]